MVSLDVPIYNQRKLGYPTGCETVSLGMMIGFAKPVEIDTLFSKLPLGFDPEKGFRGNPKDDSGFTVFPHALLAITQEYLGSAVDLSGCEISVLNDMLLSGTPVVAWVSGLGFGVHAVCLSGFDDTGFFYNDPWTGEKNAHIGFEDFYEIWNKPIRDPDLGIYYPARRALGYMLNTAPSPDRSLEA